MRAADHSGAVPPSASPQPGRESNWDILIDHGSESTAENARGAHVPPRWSGRSCARFSPEEVAF
jgi:hypothetical protein